MSDSLSKPNNFRQSESQAKVVLLSTTFRNNIENASVEVVVDLQLDVVCLM